MAMTTGASDSLLFRPDMMDPSQPSGLWWCKDAEDMQTVGMNAVCKGILAEWKELEPWMEYINSFPYILIVIPPGLEQDTAAAELEARVSIPIIIPTEDSFQGYKSLFSLVGDRGIRALDNLLLNGEEAPVHGIINLADVDCQKRKNAKRVISGLHELDSAIGGFSSGELSVWTGKRGEGKSTLLGQILLDAVNQNHVVCAYSGELPKEQFKLGLLQQAAGYLNVTRRVDQRSGRVLFDVNKEVVPYIDKWWNERLFLTDIQRKEAHDEANILKIFEYANRRYGADTFLVDNIMTAELKDEQTLDSGGLSPHLRGVWFRLPKDLTCMCTLWHTQGRQRADVWRQMMSEVPATLQTELTMYSRLNEYPRRENRNLGTPPYSLF